MGRKSKYDEYVQPHLNDIKKWVSEGATDSEVATALGISLTSLYEYKNKYPKLSEAFAHGRAKVVIDIKSALLKKALGFEYEEQKTVGKKDKDGENVILIEKYKRYCPPSETAGAMLLRNYDETWRDNDKTSADMRKQEADLRRAIAEATNFELNLNFDEEKGNKE